MITQKQLKAALTYIPKTGEFIWNHTRGRAKEGAIAGNVKASGYRYINVGGKRYLAARLAFLYQYGEFPIHKTTHRNRNRADDSWGNIREITNREVSRDRARLSSNRSGVVGVYWNPVNKNWRSGIQTEGKNKHLGSFKTFEGAALARKDADRHYGFADTHGRAA